MELQRDFYVGIVEDNKDPNRKGRIKVRVQTLYHSIPIEDIPYAYPWGGLSGKDFQVPAIGKLVNVLFLSDDLYSPYYIYSENYNINLQNKLKDLSDEEYVDFISLVYDERTNIYIDSKELTIDHLYNKFTINNDSLNLELKDNTKTLNLGSKSANQEAVLGTAFFEWMDKFVDSLLTKGSMIDSYGKDITKPLVNKACKEYKKSRKNFVSNNVKIVDNGDVDKLERTPATVYKKNDVDLIYNVIDDDQDCLNNLENEKRDKDTLDTAIQTQNENACKEGKSSAPSSYQKLEEDMLIPLIGSRISSKFGLRQDPTDSTKTQGHSGVDIVAPIGSPISNPADGVVLDAGYDTKYGGGNFIRIKHDNNFVTGYAHLSQIFVTKNQKVNRGDTIGLVGNSGGHTTGPHLHFTVTTPARVKVDPELYFTWNNSEETIPNNQYKGQEYQAQNSNNGNCADSTVDSQNDQNETGSPLSTQFDNEMFTTVTRKVIEKLEGGYFHPDMLLDGRIKDKRYKGSGETMFGIDRNNFAKKSSPAFKQFWKIIDDANARKLWKWNYFGGQYKNQLFPLVAEMMKPLYDNFAEKYLSTDALEIVNSDSKLLFHFVYATWNGQGWFKRFADPINDAVLKGIRDVVKLRKIALDSRKNNKNSLIAQSGEKIQNLFDINYV